MINNTNLHAKLQTLVSENEGSEFASKSIKPLLSSPLIYLRGDCLKMMAQNDSNGIYTDTDSIAEDMNILDDESVISILTDWIAREAA